MGRSGSWIGTVGFIAVCILALAVIRQRLGGPAAVPGAFAAHVALDDALAESAASGKPVLAFATADWCGPCQSFKRGALADERVEAWIAEHTLPAYVDLTDGDEPEAQEAARLLAVASVPALILLRDGEIVARLEGAVGADRLLEWLRAGRQGSVD
ncbi:MAG TPA: thioredoxin fold domain-containing protein [Phycisphaerales bacterium]|nr:thioredoxin fold domain-containing protein [Phycisphaerales bacterium]